MIGLRQIVFILGIIFLIRLIGKVMTARRHIREQQDLHKNQQQSSYEKNKSKQSFGKTTINKLDKETVANTKFSDFEEIHDD